MKKIIMIILTVIAIFAISTTAFAEDVFEETPDNTVIIDISKIGDANGDNKISASDARTVLRISAKLEQSPDEWSHLDINTDKKLSAADARILLRISAKLDSIEKYSECIVSGHDYIEKVIEPTCTNEGYTTIGCTRCSYADGPKVNIQPKTAHSLKKGSVVKGTCISDGYTEYKCSVCSAIEKRDVTKAGGHKYEYVSKEFIQFYEPYHFAGYKTEKKCAYCSKIIAAYEESGANIQTETQLVTSKEAKNIQEKFERYAYKIEGHDISGKKVVIYGNLKGIDIDGYYYNLDGTLQGPCPHCGTTLGEGKGMCDGGCRLSWG